MPENDRRVTGTLSTVRETGGGYLVRAQITYNGDPASDPDLSDTVYIMRGGDVLASENGVELDPGKTATVELEVMDHDGEVVVLYYGDEPGALDSTTLVAPEDEDEGGVSREEFDALRSEFEELRTQVETNSDAIGEIEAAREGDSGDDGEPVTWAGQVASATRRIVREFAR
jgi:hypothetical protein